MFIDTHFLSRCVQTLDKANALLLESQPDSIEYEMYRSAVIKEFEVILEQSGRLLKKTITPYFASRKIVDRLTFKDIFRNAANVGLLDIESVERWFEYRDNRNLTAHDYGFDLAEKTLPLMPSFISDVQFLINMINNQNDNQS
ncbi:nucleotidyltransferase substrate binding protein [Francisella philomiragia]|uniref:nucleotidyltransferase substrate binding protein n=1 Tax=Francisella philomiragia TaxID=28110 RepID=UPI00351189AF